MSPDEQRAALVAALAETGALNADWAPSFTAVPRHAFLPDTFWADESGGDTECSRSSEPERWMGLAYCDVPIVTQWDDGGGGPRIFPTSSASMPTLVAEMLSDLDARPGQRVLEIGTGTGYNAALLAHRLGNDMVSTIEVDPQVTAQARSALLGAGYTPEVVCGDGSLGWKAQAPYDRVISTVSLRLIPPTWVEQTRPGGVIVSPVSPLFGSGAVVRLTVNDDGTSASGRFTRSSAFMLLRGQRYRGEPVEKYLPGEWPGDSAQSWTKIDPEASIGDDWLAQFACALALPDVYCRRAEFGEGWTWWFFDTAVTSWATVDSVPGKSRFDVRQSGPRRLWDEVEAAYDQWVAAGRPGYERYGLTVTPTGQTAWLDEPDNPVSR
ncbi:methyltransferase domain-containing protein [Kitasatospora brasiliensis]|uniref:methyltransferase domain-containing protein n=1 Tax=Kitasatospora brasiliensis TaxID=3058040 RepID=UPI00292DD5FF|nr:methyltransferase domain-containing protein [Kitasatospora sp. K002]